METKKEEQVCRAKVISLFPYLRHLRYPYDVQMKYYQSSDQRGEAWRDWAGITIQVTTKALLMGQITHEEELEERSEHRMEP